MLRIKSSVCIFSALILLFISLNFKPVIAQAMPALYGVYPQKGSPGMLIYLLLRGDGFHSLGELSSVYILEQEIRVLNYEVISNQVMWVFIAIPEETATGETEISFIFGNVGMDAYFFVIEVEDREFSPEIHHIYPQDGEVDTVMELFFEGARLFELGELGGVIIGRLDVPVIDYFIESDQSMIIAIYLPPETPIGETGIRVFFENHGFEEFFFVRRPQPVEPEAPILYRLAPQEGLVDTDVELLLEGEGFFQLGDLVGITIAGIDIPVLDYAILSSDSMMIIAYLPPDLPTGETGIALFFENNIFEEIFFIAAPLEPEFPTPLTVPLPPVPPPPGPEFPTAVVILVVLVLVGVGSVLGQRFFRGRRTPTETPDESPIRPLARLEFIVEVDPGVQSVVVAESLIKLDINLRFEVEVDKGKQNVEMDGDSIIKGE